MSNRRRDFPPLGGGRAERTAEFIPLLVVGALALLALTLWIWRSSKIETGTLHKLSLTEATVVAPRQLPVGPPPPPQLEVPQLPADAVFSAWRARDGKAILVRPGGSELELTLEPEVQRAIEKRLAVSRAPYAAVILMDPATGAVLAMAEGRQGDSPNASQHGVTRANMPAASIFKLVTAAALLDAGVDPAVPRCYHGGSRSIDESHLIAEPHDTTCATMREAMARSINPVFARLATENLTAGDLAAAAEDLQFGRHIPFDVATEPSRLAVDAGALALGRAAAGFDGAELSPIHAALLAATVANDGLTMRPYLVAADSLQPGLRRKPLSIGRAMPASRAKAIAALMSDTVSAGSATRQFQPWPDDLAGVTVAGKTGTIDRNDDHYAGYTWFVGFAPADNPKVVVAAVAVNDRGWWMRGPTLARYALISWLQAHPDVVAATRAPVAIVAPPPSATPDPT